MSTRSVEKFKIHWYDCFSNPTFFIRKGLFNAVKDIAPLLHGEVLDFGCGSKPYRQYFTNATSYTGLDIEVSGHDHTNEHIDVYYDGKHIPFENDHFDHVFATEVFEHIFNIDEILPEIKRVIKPGGYLFITCPFVWPEHEQPYDFARYSSFGITHVLEKNGFKVEKLVKSGHHFEVIMQQWIYFIYCFLPKRPAVLYYILHQVFILPNILLASVFNLIAPRRMKRKHMYHNNVVLARKTN